MGGSREDWSTQEKQHLAIRARSGYKVGEARIWLNDLEFVYYNRTT